MACMLKNEQHQLGPRISFSNDFADPQHPMKLENSYREAPVSSDFEFSAPNFTMISADELFSKGKMVPLRENCTTLREELLAGDDDLEASSPAKGCRRWRERLGLMKRSSQHVNVVVPKKMSGKSLGSIDELKIQDIIHGDNDCFVFKS